MGRLVFFLAADEAFFETILPYLFFVRSAFDRPPLVFFFTPLQTCIREPCIYNRYPGNIDVKSISFTSL